MKPTFIALLALYLCLPLAGAETPPTPKEIAEDKASAEKGDAKASGLLARYYLNGLGLKKNMAEALKWARAAAQKGDSNGQNILGVFYGRGQGVKQDKAEAIKWYRKAADQGNMRGQYNLGAIYVTGRGVEKDFKEALKWFHKSTEQGFAPALYSLGRMYHTGRGVEQDLKEAVKWYRKAADQEWAYAQTILGQMYYTGQGVEKDFKEAVKWYRKAAAQGHATAQTTLGQMYRFGNGVKQDDREAVEWYRKAAEQGHPRGQVGLAHMYRDGKGVKQDYKKAIEWFTKAAEQGYPIAHRGLGHLHLVGWGVPKDIEKAYAWFTISVANGLADAKKSMSSVARTMTSTQITKAKALAIEMVKKNPKLINNYEEAMKEFGQATAKAEQGDAEAQYNLGVAYRDGKGVERDEKEAAKWFRKAAEQGHAEAQFTLGAMYYYGKGVPKDNVTAYAWYTHAAANGHETAKKLKELKGGITKTMTPNQITKAEKLAKEMVKKNPKLIALAQDKPKPRINSTTTTIGVPHLAGISILRNKLRAGLRINPLGGGPAEYKFIEVGEMVDGVEVLKIDPKEGVVEVKVKNKTYTLELDTIRSASIGLPKTSAEAKKPQLPKAIPEKPLPPPKPEVRLVGMMMWGGNKRIFLDIRLPGWRNCVALEEGFLLNGVEVLSIDPEKGAVKLKIKGQIVSDVVRGWPAGPKANPKKKGSVTLSFSKAPIDMVLDVFSDLSGRTIIANYHVRQGFLDFKPKGPMSEIGTLEAIQALLAAKGIGIEPLGNKFVRVLPLAQLDAKRVPKNGGAFRVVNEPPVENGKIIIQAGHTMQGIPLVTLLKEFSALTGRTIIAAQNLPRVRFDFNLKNDLSFNEAVEFYQALLTIRGIGVEPLGNKFVRVLPLAQLDAKRVPKNAGAFRVVNEPQLEEGKIVMIAGGNMMQNIGNETMLNLFSELTGRTIIAAQNLPRVNISYNLKNDLSFNEAVEFYQALLTIRGIGVEPLGNKFVRVLPLAQLDAKRVPKNAGAFRLVNEPPVEKGKIVILAGHTMQGIPLDTMLFEFGELSGRTIIAPVKLPRVTFDFSVKSDLSFNEAMELYQALLAIRGIGVELHGDKSALVLPASLLPDATYYLGVAYRDGKGVERDEKEAAKWFRKAAEQGHAEAQFTLGAMYYYAKGMPKDNVTTYAWYTLAAANGHETAKKLKGIIAKEMTPDQILEAKELSRELLKKIGANRKNI